MDIQKSGFLQKKHMYALATAKDLLCGKKHVAGINDSLNCGKLQRLINYLRNGITC